MSEWTIEYTNFAPWLETLNEVHGSTGNGYFCNRTAIPWEPSKIDIHYPATYLAGGYNRVSSQVGDRMLENEDLVNWPNWQHIRFKFDDGDWFSLHDPDIEILDFKRTYNLKNATNHFDVRVKDSAGNITRIHSDSFAHMKNANFGALGLEIEPENWVGNMTVESGIDGNVFNDNVARYRELESRHIAVTNSGRDPKTGALWLDCESSQAKQRVVEGVRTRFFLNGKAVEVSKENKPVQRDAGIFETFN
ncbi:MAG: hypothetical protein U9N14_07085, partial [Pseudomonadota bacterium]|nr:hypothetical protein [Pseudomonadota bacterium]